MLIRLKAYPGKGDTLSGNTFYGDWFDYKYGGIYEGNPCVA
jgi:hypothetical protein